MLEAYQDMQASQRGSYGSDQGIQGDLQSIHSLEDPVVEGICRLPDRDFHDNDSDNASDRDGSEPPDLTQEDSDSDSDDEAP